MKKNIVLTIFVITFFCLLAYHFNENAIWQRRNQKTLETITDELADYENLFFENRDYFDAICDALVGKNQTITHSEGEYTLVDSDDGVKSKYQDETIEKRIFRCGTRCAL